MESENGMSVKTISAFKYEQFQGARTDLPRLLKEMFKNVDDGDGVLSPEELVKIEEKLNKNISKEDAEDIIKTWDSNGDGKMTVDEFIEYKTATMHFRLSAQSSM